MFNKKKLLIITSITSLAMSAEAAAFAPTNLLTSHDYAIRLPQNKHDHRFNFGMYKLEGGCKNTGRTWDEKRVNILALHNPTQSTLAMIKKPIHTANDFEVSSLDNFFAARNIVDDGIRGNIKLAGKFEQLDASLYADYQFVQDFFGDWSLSVHVPVTYKKVSGFVWQDLTPEPGNASQAYSYINNFLIHTQLTDKFLANVKKFGGLDLSNWSKTGVGDVVALLNWQAMFGENEKDNYHMFELHGKAGVSFPTSEQKDEDQAFSMALGNDGAWGIPFGFGFALQPASMMRLGADVELLVLIDKARVRRLMTNESQTEFTLLNTGWAKKTHGFTWQFHGWMQLYHLMDGLSFSAGYQYVFHGRDWLEVNTTSGFEVPTINKANSLKEWHVHNALFKMNYDFLQYNDSGFSPHISVFYKLPFDGKNIIDTSTWGGQLTLSF